MAAIVQKFGGTSVGSVDRIKEVAKRVLDSQKKGLDPVVVVSAISGETNRLIELAKSINPAPYSREYDMILASGEQVSVGLLSLALNIEAENRGMKTPAAIPLLGYQLGIRTDNVFSKARIQAIDSERLKKFLNEKIIPVVAGFQGVDVENNITTLGRGGSDTSAVAIAASLGAECEIYTDVDGVFTTDPRLCEKAKKIKQISYEEMMELAGLGAKVLQIRSVELGAKYNVPIHVRSSFNLEEGTKVVSTNESMEQVLVSGVAFNERQVKFTLQGLPNQVGVAADIFGPLSTASVVVDIIVQNVTPDGEVTVSFTVGEDDFQKTKSVLNALAQSRFKTMQHVENQGLAKVSIVGVGMRHHPGVAAKMFELLGKEGIDIGLITTSEIKVSVLIPGEKVKTAVTCLHKGFQLDLVD